MNEVMRQAIIIKYVGPTNTRGSRVRVKTGSGLSMMVPWDSELDTAENHIDAAQAMMKKQGWDQYNDIVGGGTQDGYVFVQIDKRKKNPAHRIGAEKPRRKSQVTGEKPSMRLIQRRTKNTKKGYYPNPMKSDMRYLVSVSPTGKEGVNPDGSRNWFKVAAFKENADAMTYAKSVSASHPKWQVRVEKEK